MVAPYPDPVPLGDWYPKVTHINGMAVAPKSGLLSAAALQETVNTALGGKEDVAFGQDAVDMLYTYSAQRGNVDRLHQRQTPNRRRSHGQTRRHYVGCHPQQKAGNSLCP